MSDDEITNDLDAICPERYPTLRQWILCERPGGPPDEVAGDCIKLLNDPSVEAIERQAARMFGSNLSIAELQACCLKWLRRDRGMREYDAQQILLGDLAGLLGEAVKPALPKRQRRQPARDVKALTSRETEAVQMVGEHSGNYSAAARAMGISAARARTLYRNAMKKLGSTATRAQMKMLPRDNRGQENLSWNDDD